jgi:hypothetical protein
MIDKEKETKPQRRGKMMVKVEESRLRIELSPRPDREVQV